MIGYYLQVFQEDLVVRASQEYLLQVPKETEVDLDRLEVTGYLAPKAHLV